MNASLSEKEDIPKILEGIVEIHNIEFLLDKIVELDEVKNPKGIVKALLKKHNHELLINIIKGLSDGEIQEKNDFFMVGLYVYRYVYDDEFSMEKAIEETRKKIFHDTGKKTILANTIKSHRDALSTLVREDMDNVGYKLGEKNRVQNYMNDFFTFYDENDERTHNYGYPIWDRNNKKSVFESAYKDFVENLRSKSVPF